MKLAVARPAADGDYPAHVEKFKQLVVTSLQKLRTRYPNVRLVYLSNRIYAGYATTPLNPEPYAYEYAYGIRGLILDQIGGNPELNYDPEKGEVKAPLLLWGPDLWANGTTARTDGLVWEKGDLGPDGTHPSMPGRVKVAKLLLGFLRSDPTARIWFVEEQPPPE
jgi:lysophospholipase L1-like esterase